MRGPFADRGTQKIHADLSRARYERTKSSRWNKGSAPSESRYSGRHSVPRPAQLRSYAALCSDACRECDSMPAAPFPPTAPMPTQARTVAGETRRASSWQQRDARACFALEEKSSREREIQETINGRPLSRRQGALTDRSFEIRHDAAQSTSCPGRAGILICAASQRDLSANMLIDLS